MQRPSSSPFHSSLLARVAVAGLALSLSACDSSEPLDPKPGSDSTQESSEASKTTPEATQDTKKKESKGETPKSKKESPDQDSGEKDESGEESSDSSTQEPDQDSSDTQEPEKDESGKDDTGKEDPDQDNPGESGPIPCEGEAPKVVLETNQGTIKLLLDGKRAPNTVTNYNQYVNDKHYDNTLFHRVLSDFMIQGGGYDLNNKLKKERPPIKLEIHPELRHKAGTLAMARTNVKDSATAQFYICVDDSGCKHLDGEYAAFGQTVEGLDVVKKISEVPKSKEGKPDKDVILTKAYCVSDW